MNETKKTIDKKQLLIKIIGVIVVIILVVCFIIALKNHNSNKSSSSSSTSSTSNSNSSALSSSSITSGGNYEITGNNKCITINTTDKVELDLNNSTITCDSGPAINIESAGKVSIVLIGENTIISTTTEDLDGAIYSKDDLEFSGSGSLNITSNYDGIVSKDDLVINEGTYTINSEDDGIRGKDSVEINNGTFNITASGDGIKATNDEDNIHSAEEWLRNHPPFQIKQEDIEHLWNHYRQRLEEVIRNRDRAIERQIEIIVENIITVFSVIFLSK